MTIRRSMISILAAFLSLAGCTPQDEEAAQSTSTARTSQGGDAGTPGPDGGGQPPSPLRSPRRRPKAAEDIDVSTTLAGHLRHRLISGPDVEVKHNEDSARSMLEAHQNLMNKVKTVLEKEEGDSDISAVRHEVGKVKRELKSELVKNIELVRGDLNESLKGGK